MLQRGTILRSCILVGIACVTLLPFYWMVSSSLKTMENMFSMPLQWIPDPDQLDARTCDAWQAQDFTRYFLNSGFVAIAITVGNLLLALARRLQPHASSATAAAALMFLLILSTMMLPLEVTMVPLFLIVKQLGLAEQLSGPDRALPGGRLRRLPDAPVHAEHSQRPDRFGAHRRRLRAADLLDDRHAAVQARARRARRCSRSARPGTCTSGR